MDLNKTLNKFQQTLVRGGLIKEAGLEQSRRARALLKLSASPLESVASKFGMDLDKMLLRPFIEQQILAANSLPPMDFDPDCAVTLGHHLELKVPILVARKKLTENLLVIGSVGSGKSSYLYWIMDQLVRRNIHITFYDFKGEAPRLLNYYA